MHAHANLRDKLRRRDRADFDNRLKTLRQAQGKLAGEEAFEELMEFMSEHNAAAALTLGERKDALLARVPTHGSTSCLTGLGNH